MHVHNVAGSHRPTRHGTPPRPPRPSCTTLQPQRPAVTPPSQPPDLAVRGGASLEDGGDERLGEDHRSHRQRLAAVYLRQSSMAQIREHTQSPRQYGLVDQAVRLGWDRQDVVVIDTDLGALGRWGWSARASPSWCAGSAPEGGGDLRDRDLPAARSNGAVGGVRRDYRNAADRRRWHLRSGRCQRPDAAGYEEHHGRGGPASNGSRSSTTRTPATCPGSSSQSRASSCATRLSGCCRA
jgi:hypothetical protein